MNAPAFVLFIVIFLASENIFENEFTFRWRLRNISSKTDGALIILFKLIKFSTDLPSDCGSKRDIFNLLSAGI